MSSAEHLIQNIERRYLLNIFLLDIIFGLMGDFIMNFDQKMIAYGYLAKEIPSEFQTESLAKVLDKIQFDSLTNQEKSIWAKPIHFTIPNGEGFRRLISIPSPLHQILLCKLISENWEELQIFFRQSNISMTTPVVSSEENIAIESKINIKEKMNIRMKYLHNKNYILQTDISRFYPTIYTHVIPWAYHTKDYIKKNINKKNLLGNKIDSRIQFMQDGQTFGIPIGPATSQVISEIVATAIDVDFKELINSEVPGFRYTDDIEYYFDSEELAKEALSKIHKVVNAYQLELNPIKTKIIKAPVAFEPEWKQYFSSYFFRKTVLGQRSDLNSYFSRAFSFKHSSLDKGVLQYALKKVRSEIILEENWDIFESLLLHSAFSDHSTLPVVLEIIELYIIKNYQINQNRFKEFLEKLIKINIHQGNHFEVCWALVYSKRIEISLSKEVTNLLLNAEDSITCILTMILSNKGLLEGNLNFNKYKKYLNKEELYGSNWLFAYEAFKQGWLRPYSNPDYVLEDSFFNILYQNDVSFLQDEVSLYDLRDMIIDSSTVESTEKTEISEEETEAEESTEKTEISEEETEAEESTEKTEISEGETEAEESTEKTEISEGETEAEESTEKTEISEGETEVEESTEKTEISEGETEVEESTEKTEISEGETKPEEIFKLYSKMKNTIYKNNAWLIKGIDTNFKKDKNISTYLGDEGY
ncbi:MULTISPECIES: RNA-directed DNA polymerase [Bacillus]|uniref:RNA-directed DNA polymerase n=1 Tax=Bacillus TaxID=1386 RepID=UPI00397B533F